MKPKEEAVSLHIEFWIANRVRVPTLEIQDGK